MTDPVALSVVTRVLASCGSQSGAATLRLSTFRRWPRHPSAVRAAGWLALGKGPYQLLLFQRRHGIGEDPTPQERIYWQLQHAHALVSLGDVERASVVLSSLDHEDPFVVLGEVEVLRRRERLADAIRLVDELIAANPTSHRARVVRLDLLLELERNDEHTADLEALEGITPDGSMSLRLAREYLDRGDTQRAREALARATERLPFAESLCSWYAELRLLEGDLRGAAADAAKVGTPFFDALAARLEKTVSESSSSGLRRTVLPVPRVLQRAETCAPATLAAICGFHGISAPQTEIVEAICYDGTPGHSQRTWATQRGFVAREFQLTWASAKDCIDRGLPVALSTVEATSSHLSALVGYDERAGTLLIRDPGDRSLVEYSAEPLFARYAATGPRALLLVPSDKAGLLDGLDLPRAAEFDHLHQVQVLLDRHDRAGAGAYYEVHLETADSFVSDMAARSLARYDRDGEASLRATRRTRARHPEDEQARAWELSAMAGVSSHEERRERLEQEVSQKNAPSVFREMLARLLIGDSRTLPRARLLAARARADHTTSSGFDIAARIESALGRHADAAELARFATMLAPRDEVAALDYFYFARANREEDAAIRWLRARIGELRDDDGRPVRTLCDALSTSGRELEADQVLEAGLAEVKDDGVLRLYAATVSRVRGLYERAEAQLATARDRVSPRQWLRESALLSEAVGEDSRALAAYRQLAEQEPTVASHREDVARLLEATSGIDEALRYLADEVARHPHNVDMGQAWVMAASRSDPDARDRALDDHLSRHPSDAWAHREQAAHWLGRDPTISLQALDRAAQLEPAHPYLALLRCLWLRKQGREAEAFAVASAAFEANPDRDDLMSMAFACAPEGAAAGLLATTERVIAERATEGATVDELQRTSLAIVGADASLAIMRRVAAARPSDVSVRVALLSALSAAGHVDERETLAKKMEETDLRDARAQLAVADVWRQAGRPDQVSAVLTRALENTPADAALRLALVEALLRDKEDERARAVLNDGTRGHDADPALLSKRGRMKLQDGDHVAAARMFLRAASQGSWGAVYDLEDTLEGDARDAVVAVVDAWVQARSFDPMAHAARSICDSAGGAFGAAVDRLERAIRLRPLNFRLYDEKARLLTLAGEHDAALAATRPAAFGDTVPAQLLARRAWSLHRAERYDEAIDCARQALREAPSVTWLRGELAAWQLARGAYAVALRDARVHAQLAPLDPSPHVQMGGALLGLGEADEALAAYSEALRLDAAQPFAAWQAVFLLLLRGRLDEAKRITKRADEAGISLRVSLPRVAARESAEAFGLYVSTRLASADFAVDEGQNLVVVGATAGHARSVVDAIGRAYASGNASPAVGQMYGRFGSGKRLWFPLFHRVETEAQLAAAHHALARRPGWFLSAFALLRRRVCLREGVGFDVARWLLDRDWPASAALAHAAVDAGMRDALPSWVLHNYALALRRIGLGRFASGLHYRALEQEASEPTMEHSLWAALFACASGDDARARRLLSPFAEADCEGSYGALRRIIVRVSSSTSDDVCAVWTAVEGDLAVDGTASDTPLALSLAKRALLRRAQATDAVWLYGRETTWGALLLIGLILVALIASQP